MPVEQISESWFFKSNQDGIFVKVNEERVKNRQGHLMEGVIDLKELPGNAQKGFILVSFYMCYFYSYNWLFLRKATV